MEEGLEKLEIYRISHEGALRIHRMSLILPALERFEEAPQVRRSAKRVPASIVEGYGQRRYKGTFLVYLYRAVGSSDETQEHLRLLRDTGSLPDRDLAQSLLHLYEVLSGKIFSYIEVIEKRYSLPRYLTDEPPVPEEPEPPRVRSPLSGPKQEDARLRELTGLTRSGSASDPVWVSSVRLRGKAATARCRLAIFSNEIWIEPLIQSW